MTHLATQTPSRSTVRITLKSVVPSLPPIPSWNGVARRMKEWRWSKTKILIRKDSLQLPVRYQIVFKCIGQYIMTRKMINFNLLLRGCHQLQQLAFPLQHDPHMSMIRIVINQICYIILLQLNHIYDWRRQCKYRCGRLLRRCCSTIGKLVS